MLNKFSAARGPVIRRTATHLYLAAHPLLRRYIAHYTVMRADADAKPNAALSLIPDGSGCLVFIPQSRPESYCWGATTQLVSVNTGPSMGLHLFVEFLPGGQRRLTTFPQRDLTDRRIPLALLDRELEARVFTLLDQAADTAALAAGLDAIFLERLARYDALPPALLALGAPSAATVRELSDAAGYSQRHLGRVFLDGTGMGLKTYLRLLRINRALSLVRPEASLSWVAQEAGYYDQSHFNHEFRAVCGVSPRVYLQNMSDFYKETLKFQGILK